MGGAPPNGERRTLDNCLRNLRSLPGCAVELLPGDGEGGKLLTLRGAWGEVTFRIHLHLRLTPKTAPLVRHQMEEETDPPPLLLTDFLPENLALPFRARRLCFMDECGNCHLLRMPLHIEIAGRKRRLPAPPKGRLFQGNGLKLIFLLLADPEAVAWDYRRLARHADIALGAVGSLLEALRQQGFLRGKNRRGRRLTNLTQLLERWEIGYRETLHDKLLLHRCRLPEGASPADLPGLLKSQGLMSEVLIGGGLGAHLLLDHPEPAGAALHLTGDPLRLMLRLRLVPDPEGEIDLLARFSPADEWRGWSPEGVRLADPLLIHAELAGRDALTPELEHRFSEHRLLLRQPDSEG
ncbi:MAG: hypothetical protein JXB25_04270 [Deltaproteobacteria bacterium]|nr:hypothetical protein [Deltaproteobacteria bacterium]